MAKQARFIGRTPLPIKHKFKPAETQVPGTRRSTEEFFSERIAALQMRAQFKEIKS